MFEHFSKYENALKRSITYCMYRMNNLFLFNKNGQLLNFKWMCLRACERVSVCA